MKIYDCLDSLKIASANFWEYFLSVLDKNSSIAIEGLIFICGIESHSNLFQKLTNILMKKN